MSVLALRSDPDLMGEAALANDCDLPPIVIGRRDADRLYAIAMRVILRSPRLAGALIDEVLRASVEDDDKVPAGVAGLNSLVLYHAAGSALPQWVQLVAPEEADPEAGRISVLSPTGSALIGLSAGQAIRWADRVGGAPRLVVLAVRPAEPPTPGRNDGDQALRRVD